MLRTISSVHGPAQLQPHRTASRAPCNCTTLAVCFLLALALADAGAALCLLDWA